MATPKIVVVTYASDPKHEGLLKLARTLAAWGWEFRPQVGPWQGFVSKLRGVHAALPKLAEEGFTHVLFTDAYDTVCVGPPDAVIPYCDDGILLSCEKACWPDAGLAKSYPSSPRSEWCHVNSGGYLGAIPALYAALMNADGDDQLWLTKKFLSDENKMTDAIKRDDGCEVFQTVGHTVLPWCKWNEVFEKHDDCGCPGRVYNKITGTYPVFVHGNGRAPMEWLNDHLRLGDKTLFAGRFNRELENEYTAPLAVAVEKPPITHWSQIGGFGEHDYAPFYERLVEEAPPGAIIVEVGCYLGRSLCHLGTVAKAANKGLRIFGFDHCEGESGGMDGVVQRNVNILGLGDTVVFEKWKSVEAVVTFEDETVWCAFLDDGHLHEEVASGVDAWMPKVRKDGILAGHDAIFHTVWETVKAKLPSVCHDPLWRDCWFCRKETPLTDVDIRTPVRVMFEHGDAMFGYGVGDKRSDGLPSGSPLTARSSITPPE